MNVHVVKIFLLSFALCIQALTWRRRERHASFLVVGLTTIMAAEILLAVPSIFSSAEESILVSRLTSYLGAPYVCLITWGLLFLTFGTEYHPLQENYAWRVRTRTLQLIIGGVGVFLVACIVQWLLLSHVNGKVSIMGTGFAGWLLTIAEVVVVILLARNLLGDESIPISAKWLAGSSCFLLGIAAIYRNATNINEWISAVGWTGFGLAWLMSRAIQREHLYEETMLTKDQQSELLFDMARTLNQTFELDDVLQLSLDNLMQMLQGEAGAIYLLRGNRLVPTAIRGAFPPPEKITGHALTKIEYLHQRLRALPISIGQGILGKGAEQNTPILIQDAEVEEVEQTIPDLLKIRSFLVLPLKREESIYGVIGVVNKMDETGFSVQDVEFAAKLVEQINLAIHNADLHQAILDKQQTEADLRIAKQVQHKLIPSDLPQIANLDISAVYQAARAVGGDYYDFFAIDDHTLGIVIADVSGKGIAGAMLMAMTKSILKMVVPRVNSTKQVLQEVNRAIYPEIRRGMFVTAEYIIIDTKERCMHVSRAGHTPVMIHRTSQKPSIELCIPRGIALGIDSGKLFDETMQEEVISLDSGDRVFLYTDGVDEAMNPQDEQFEESRVRSFIERNTKRESSEFLALLMEELNEFRGETEQSDDIAAVTFRVN